MTTEKKVEILNSINYRTGKKRLELVISINGVESPSLTFEECRKLILELDEIVNKDWTKGKFLLPSEANHAARL